MKGYIEFRNKVDFYKNLKEVLTAQEKISASYLHFLKHKNIFLDEYLNQFMIILERLQTTGYLKEMNISPNKTGEKILIIIGPEKSLSGGLDHKIINTLIEVKKDYNGFIVIGDKMIKDLKNLRFEILESFIIKKELITIEDIREIYSFLFDRFMKGKFQKIDVLYPEFITLLLQYPRIKNFLPINFEKKESQFSEGLSIFEPNKKDFIKEVFKKYTQLLFYNFVLESKISEYIARVVFLEHANSKIEQLTKISFYQYLKERKRVISQIQNEVFVSNKILKKYGKIKEAR